MRCSARRRRAAATISIARVILWMFLTDAIRFLTSFWVAIGAHLGGDFLLGLLDRALGLLGLGLRLGLLARLLLGASGLLVLLAILDPVGLALLERLSLGVEVGAEVVDHLGDGLAERPLVFIGELAGLD